MPTNSNACTSCGMSCGSTCGQSCTSNCINGCFGSCAKSCAGGTTGLASVDPDVNPDLIGRIPKEVIEFLVNFKLTDIVDLPQTPELSMNDTLVVVTNGKVTMKASTEQFMQFLNQNLKNFICWKPVVTNSTLTWERSSSDEAPGSLRFEDIMFPIASPTTTGMMEPEMYIKLYGIDSDNIVYLAKLNEELAKKAEKNHAHDQYQLIDNMPTKLTDFRNDAGFITSDAIPTNISSFTNDKNYVRFEDIPIVDINTNGLMSTDMLNILNQINDTFVDQDQITEVIQNISDSLPTNISAFENDVGYVKASNLIGTIGELGSINIIKNSEFMFTNGDGTLKDWFVIDGTLSQFKDDPDYAYCAKAVLNSGGLVKGTLSYGLGTYHTITFYAKASAASTFVVTLGDGTKTINVGTFWSKFTFTLENKGTTADQSFKISIEGADPVTLYLTRVKVERGRLSTEYFPSYDDINNMINRKATTSEFGIVKPDNYAIGFDSQGRLTILNNPDVVGVQIDDENTSEWTTYSSFKTEERLRTKAPIVNGLIPAEYIPGSFDEVVNGEMTMDGNTQVFVIAPGQYTTGDPDKGKMYVDTKTHLAYLWTGETYVACTTDRLGGQVLVKYDQDEQCMYFVFPDS